MPSSPSTSSPKINWTLCDGGIAASKTVFIWFCLTIESFSCRHDKNKNPTYNCRLVILLRRCPVVGAGGGAGGAGDENDVYSRWTARERPRTWCGHGDLSTIPNNNHFVVKKNLVSMLVTLLLCNIKSSIFDSNRISKGINRKKKCLRKLDLI